MAAELACRTSLSWRDWAEVRRDLPAGDIPASDHHFAHQEGAACRDIGFGEYNRVLRIVTELMVNGIMPDESEWVKAQAASAGTDPE